ncbi:DEAD/DEAH box helicase family protein [Agrobacterium fabrum]|uniref:DEAD/DEAH box helicase family protein n=1 Tax=Agrobacterium fabrum TaxID=1176649 RepID=UPI000EF60185|nr:DEAD/DEAH box helicase family protein [Agrobacterium fabrum]AYM66124.1 hypothetical protein At12D13_49720 [Agrobacterium fabrum]NTE63971.1 DEAD/DEAH box helicase family protein [Agrobacterium fabrum]
MYANHLLEGAVFPLPLPERHVYPDRITVHQAKALLRRTIREFLVKVRRWIASGKQGEIPRLVLKAGAGTGKTVSMLAAVAKLLKEYPDLRILFSAPSVELCEEVEEKAINEFGIANARVARGRSQPRPDDKSQNMCAFSDMAESLASLQMSVSKSLCSNKKEDGTEVRCRFFDTCPYMKQIREMKQPGLIIASHQYLSVELDALKGIDLVIIDESFHQTMTFEKKVPIERFKKLRALGDSYKGKKGESHADFEIRREDDQYELDNGIDCVSRILNKCEVEKHQWTIDDFLAEGITSEFARHMKKLEYSRLEKLAVFPDMDDDIKADKIAKAKAQEAYGFGRFWSILEIQLSPEVVAERDGLIMGLRLLFDHMNKEDEIRDYISLRWSKDPRFLDVATVMIDADADELILERFYPGAEFVRIEAEWQEPIKPIQADNWVGSKKSMSTERRKDEAFNTAIEMADRLSHLIKGDPKKRPLLVSHKSVIDGYREEFENQADVSLEQQPIDLAHFGNLRGKDGWKHAVGIVVVGRQEPTVDAVEAIAEGIWFATPKPIRFIRSVDRVFPSRKTIISDKQGNEKTIDVSYHPDERCDRVLKQIREAEVMQAIARIRPIHRETPCEVIILTKIPLPIQPERFWGFESIVPDRFTMVRMNGWIPENAQDMADAYPGLFPTANAVTLAAFQRDERAFPQFEGRAFPALAKAAGKSLSQPIYDYMGNERVWVRVSYTRTLKTRSRTRSGWLLVDRSVQEEQIFQTVAQIYPDAANFSVVMLPAPAPAELEMAPAANDNAPRPVPSTPTVINGRDVRNGIRVISPEMLTLAQSVAEEKPWQCIVPAYKSRRLQIRLAA